MEGPSITLGQRIGIEASDAGVSAVGTVRYVGPLKTDTANNSQTWIGVEWDEWYKRGKHNGTVNGHTYFVCPDNCGSLVLPEKLSLGVSFLQAVVEKYILSNNSLIPEDELYVLNEKGLFSKKVELVGMAKISAKQQKLDTLTQVSLNNSFIRTADKDIHTVTPKIEDIDLAGNLFTSWETIIEMSTQLPYLEVLNLSYNKLAYPSESFEFSQAFLKLRILVLNYCDIKSLDELNSLEKKMPKLKELHLCYNGITSLSSNQFVTGFSELEILNVEGNNISDWSEIRKLSKLEKLDRLIVNQNKISSIHFEEGDFSQLKSLSVSNNYINIWSSIDQIDRLPVFEALRLQNNPIIDQHGPSISRNLFIARISKLSSLNGSPLSAKDRSEAEKFYLKFCINSGLSVEEIEKENPRYAHLVSVYGAPDKAKKEAQTLAEELISVTLVCMQNGSTTNKKLPVSMTVGNLKILCNRLFKMETSKQNLFYKESKENPYPEALDDDSRPLSYYDVKENTTIIVEEKM